LGGHFAFPIRKDKTPESIVCTQQLLALLFVLLHGSFEEDVLRRRLEKHLATACSYFDPTCAVSFFFIRRSHAAMHT
jgi:hypothetical protein